MLQPLSQLLAQKTDPSDLELLRLKLQAIVPSAKLIGVPSLHDGEPAHQPWSPLFFYHTRKVGGTLFFDALYCSMRHYLQQLSFKEQRGVGRIDIPLQLEETPTHLRYALLCSHLPFGTHKRFAEKFDLLMLSRDPLRRVLSHYGYEMMRNDWLPLYDDFCEHIHDPAQQNQMTKQLAGFNPATKVNNERLWELALQNLDQFRYYFAVDGLPEVLASFLCHANFTSLIYERVNVTLDQYRPQFPDKDDEVRSLNMLDEKLHQLLSETPRKPPPARGAFMIPLVTLVADEQTKERNKGLFLNAYLDHLLELCDRVIQAGRQFPSFASLISDYLVYNAEPAPRLA